MVPYQEIVETLVSIEHATDVNAVRFENLKIWPLIRAAIYEQLRYPDRKNIIHYEQPRQVTSNTFLLPELASRELNQRKGVDLFFLSFPFEYSDCVGTSYFNPWIDTVLIPARKQGYSVVKVEPYEPSSTPRFEETIFVPPIHKESRQAAPTLQIYGFHDLHVAIREQTRLEIGEALFIQQTLDVLAWQQFFEQVLRTVQPKVVLMENYYCIPAMALIRAAHVLGLPTVDIQHGGIENLHGMYTHWSQVPFEGYDLVPDYFWCWGSTTKCTIEHWLGRRAKRPQAIVGGHPRLLYHFENPEPQHPREWLQFLDSLRIKEKVILVTLDGNPGHEEPLFLYQGIKSAPSNWFWLFRLHPVFKGKEQEGRIQEIIERHGITNCELDFSTSIPLLTLLQYCHHHVTGASSASFEALALGVPTTFTHPHALLNFHTAINQGFFVYTDNAEVLLERISTAAPPKTDGIDAFIRETKAAFRSAIDEFLFARRILQEKATMLRARAEKLFQRGDVQTAAALLQHSIEVDPFCSIGYSDLSAVLWTLGSKKEAEQAIRKALFLDTFDRNIIMNAICILKELGKTDEAGIIGNNFLRCRPHDQEVQSLLS